MGINSLNQLDCRIFRLTISPEQSDEKNLIFCMLLQFHVNYKLIKKYWGGLGMVKNGCDHSCLRTQKLTVSEEKNNEVN